MKKHIQRSTWVLGLGFIGLFICGSACKRQLSHATKPHTRTAQKTIVSQEKHAKKINARFLDPKLNTRRWKNVFEREKREVFRYRKEIVRSLGLKPGQSIADVGAGSGAFMAQMVSAVGPKGTVYAVEISPKFVAFLKHRAKRKHYTQVKVIHSTTRSTRLPAKSVDMVFVCDTYHHFGTPAEMLADFRRILRPGGRLVIVDFKRIPGVTESWLMKHVRQNKKQVIDQIKQHGFTYTRELHVPGLKANYIIAFQARHQDAKAPPQRRP